MLQLFDTLRSQNDHFQSKVVPVAGDILEPGLGLTDSDVEHLSSEVSLVFHSAATVKFDEPLKWELLLCSLLELACTLMYTQLTCGLTLSSMNIVLVCIYNTLYYVMWYLVTSAFLFILHYVPCVKNVCNVTFHPIVPFRFSVNMNVIGVSRIVELCRKLCRLEVL